MTPSLNVAAILAGASRAPIASALIVAPLRFDGRHPDLPASEGEAAEVDRMLRLAGARTTVLRGDQAVLSALRRMAEHGELAGYDLIHFATHACAEPSHARLSSIALRDGDVTLQEILSWRLNARLVNVSACEGAFSVTFGGEERIGLEMALLAAGAQTVVSSQWPVEDSATARIMAEFTRRFAAVGDAGASLAMMQDALADAVSASDIAAWRVLGMG